MRLIEGESMPIRLAKEQWHRSRQGSAILLESMDCSLCWSSHTIEARPEMSSVRVPQQ